MKGVDPDRTTFPYSPDPKESKALERQFSLPELRLPAGGVGEGVGEVDNAHLIMLRPCGIQGSEVFLELGAPFPDLSEKQTEIDFQLF